MGINLTDYNTANATDNRLVGGIDVGQVDYSVYYGWTTLSDKMNDCITGITIDTEPLTIRNDGWGSIMRDGNENCFNWTTNEPQKKLLQKVNVRYKLKHRY